MLKFILGLLAGVIVTFLIVVIAFFSLVRFREKPAVIADGSTLVLRLDGSIPERTPIEYPIPFFQRKTPLTVQGVWSLLRKAAVDPHIKAVVLEPQGVQVGWGKLQEIRADLEQFRVQSGKPLYAYLKSPGTREYYLATAASRIYIQPTDLLNMKGMRFELMYFKRTLDKVGVRVDVEHAGKYKDFGDMFTRTSMSQETKEVLDSVIDDLYADLVNTIAKARKKSPEEIRATMDDGPFLSTQALAKGLVDELRFEDEMYGELKAALHSDIKKVSDREYLRVDPSSLGLTGQQRIAFVTADGEITQGDPDGSGSDTGIESEHFDRLLRAVGSDSGIKGVIVRIDSPGGEVFASDAIWREMNLLSKKKPVVISMSDSAASGGYYMAMTGDPIVAYPGTLTGSIGVVFGKPNLHGLYDKLGIDKDTLKRGRFADLDSDYQPLSDEGRTKLREGIDENYRAFVTKVATARKRKFEDVEPLAQGRVWLGDQAKDRGLVDQLGGIDKAIEVVKQKAGIAKDTKVTLVAYPPKRSILDVMFSPPSVDVLSEMDPRIGEIARKVRMRAWMKGGMLSLAPFTLEVQ